MRSDANSISTNLIGQILEAAHDFDCEVGGANVHVVSTRAKAPKWPASAETPPAAIDLACSWPSGSVDLVFSADIFGGRGPHAGMVALKIALARTQAQILWITLPVTIGDHADGEELLVPASVTAFKRKGDGNIDDLSNALRQAFDKSGIPKWKTSDGRALAFSVRLPTVLTPSAREIFERLVTIALLKLPAFAREPGLIEGHPPFSLPPPSPVVLMVGGPTDEKLAGLSPLPGGVREFKTTADELLARIGDGCSRAELEAHFRTRYEVTGKTALQNYIGLLARLGLIRLEGTNVILGENAANYLPGRTPLALFRILDETFSGFLEMLVVAKEMGAFGDAESVALFKQLLDVDWESPNQVSFRRNWLLSLGAFEREDGDDTLTPLGEELLGLRPEDRAAIEERLEALQEESSPEEVAADETVEAVQAPSWESELELSAAAIARHADLKLAPELLNRAAVALCAGKHLLLIGPPGTGKTELALALGEAARSEGYCLGTHTATASADWTTFDTVGGYSLQKDSSLRFRSGALLRALEQKKWLLVDELNRADVDRAFGELMTVLSGGSTDTAYETDAGRQIRIGPDRDATHFVPPSFRVIATMNTWDKTSLFRLSFAVQRRFAILYVGCPPAADYAALLVAAATGAGPGQPLPEARASQIAALFSPSGLLAQREIGPAIALDVVRYTRRRLRGGDGLAEALGMFLLAQLEGLSDDDARGAWKAIRASLAEWTQPSSVEELRKRFVDLFPDSGVE